MQINALTRTNKKASKHTKKIIFDIETIGTFREQIDIQQDLGAYALGSYDGQKFKLYEGTDCVKLFLADFLKFKYRYYIAYAHNGGKFDFNFILKELCTKEYLKTYTISPMRIGSRIVQIKIEDQNNHTWTLRDSFTLLSFSLRDLTNNFNVPHKKGEFDHKKLTWKNYHEYKNEWLPYLESDCKGLYEVLQTYEEYLLTKFQVNLRKNITIAQLSLCIYRQNHLNTVIPNYQSKEEDIRKAYYGGRVEIFKHHGKNLHYYDVNSLYPYVMKNYPMPVGTPVRNYQMSIHDFGVAYCSIITPDDIKIPVLPYKQKTKNGYKLIFPRGQFTGWYCTPELRKATELGYQIKIHYGYEFKQEYLFTNYIDEMYSLKENSPKGSVGFITSKSLMNNLYGKFGQKREKQQIVIFPKSSIGMEPMDFFGELPFFTQKVESKARHILPAIAAMVTCYARLHLYQYLETCDPLYCDTDSIITAKELPKSSILGDLKDEMPVGIEEAYFFLPKMYAIRDNDGKEYVKCKGFPNKQFTFEDFAHAYVTKDMSAFKYTKDKFALPFESMKRNKTFVSMLTVSRRVMTQYDKRITKENGETEALNIKE